MPLNPTLHALLRNEFGNVRLAHEGEEMIKTYVPDYDGNQHPPRIRLKPPDHAAGEYFRIDCPVCGDTRGRLWINYLWGVWDREAQSYNLWLCHCFNEDCMSVPGKSKELFDRVYRFRNANQRDVPIEILSGDLPEEVPGPVEWPGECVSLSELGPEHPAVQYLTARGYDHTYLAERFGLTYCVRALPDYRTAEGRIILPIVMNGDMVSWQGRYVGDLDWKKAGVPKYYNLPNVKRSRILYNFDNAKEFPYVVLVEGATGPWNLDGPVVSLLGKVLSSAQTDLVVKTWGVACVLMDGDEYGQSAAQEITDSLTRYIKCFKATLPSDVDPGNANREWAWSLIHSAVRTAGLDLTTITKSDACADSTTNPDRSKCGANGEVDQGGDRREKLAEGVVVPDGAVGRPRYAATRTQLR